MNTTTNTNAYAYFRDLKREIFVVMEFFDAINVHILVRI